MAPWSDKAFIVNLLHLSDLHFEVDSTHVRKAHRSAANASLLQTLGEIIAKEQLTHPTARHREDDWTPDLVAVSGDIAFSGHRDDYARAEDFLTQLLNLLGLHPDDVILCPGNHDRNVRRSYPIDARQCDDWLSPDKLLPFGEPGQLPPLIVPFIDYVEFAQRFGAMKPAGLRGLEYLTGTCTRSVRRTQIDFFVLNSAWFSQPGPGDMRNMWLGLPLIEALSGARDVPPVKQPDGETKRLRVGLCHHTREWLHQDEHDSYSDRPNTFRKLAESCDLLLHGHVHGALEPPTRAHNVGLTTGLVPGLSRSSIRRETCCG